ncbi:MAG: hypothetical protein M1818_005057 [Claussenomyces sp. TS43310]|nr:MAG: hypothetical protein M1818_005057 [Claussenomyces sp. TS43310]
MTKRGMKRKRKVSSADVQSDRHRELLGGCLTKASRQTKRLIGNENDDSFTEQQPVVLTMKAGPRKKAEAVQASRCSEYSEDPDLTHSQGFLRLVETAANTKSAPRKVGKFIGEFAKGTQLQENKLIDMLGKHKVMAATLDSGFLDNFKALHTSVTDLSSRATIRAISNLHDESVNILLRAQNVVEDFEGGGVSLALRDPHSILILPNHVATQHLRNMLEVGQQVCAREVETVLRGLKEDHCTFDIRQASALLVEWNDRRSQDISWARLARKLEKVIKTLAETLPSEFVN